MKSFIQMAQEISVLMGREYPMLNMPITSKITKVLFSGNEHNIKEFIDKNSEELVKHKALYKYLIKNMSEDMFVSFIK